MEGTNECREREREREREKEGDERVCIACRSCTIELLLALRLDNVKAQSERGN